MLQCGLKGIQKAGFEYVGKLYLDEYNNPTIEYNETALSFQEELEYMDIHLSAQTASSCWNCSSPYIRKRSPECCCSTAGEVYIGNSMMTMAS